MAENQTSDTAVYTWFMQIRGQGQPVSGPLICEKAMELNRKLGGKEDFKSSTGWLTRFKSRHGIRELDIQGKKLSAETGAAEKFKETFKSLLENQRFIRTVTFTMQMKLVYTGRQCQLNSLYQKKRRQLLDLMQVNPV